MDHSRRPLTKRPRAFIACNTCRHTKSKCDGNAPTCERCARLGLDCVYSQSGPDKRLSRRTERKDNLELRNRVRELEAQLATSRPSPQSHDEQQRNIDPSNPQPDVHPGGMATARIQPNSNSSDVNSQGPSRAASSHESPVDVLAAGVFDHPSAGYMCYFGSTSNHAVFWSLTASIANLGHRSSRLFQEPLRPAQAQGGPAQLPIPPSSSVSNYFSNDPGGSSMPERATAMRWISRFFDTVGATLPYVAEPALVEGLAKVQRDTRSEHPSTRAVQALLNIVFAHALSTLEEEAPEPYYRRTLCLLDPKTLYVSSLELLQALLLLSIYQQNSQRSTESLTTHALAVKTSYHLGVHATFLYDFVSVNEKELRARLWFAVVNQDRMLSTALGQPCLIPLQHVRMDLADLLVTTRQSRTVEMSYSREDLSYFRNIISLHEIMGITLDSIYGSNISPSTRVPLAELTPKTLDLSLRLQQWRNTSLPRGPIGSDVDFSTWTKSSFDSERNKILTSVLYYRTMILIHGSVLMLALELATSGSGEISSMIVRDSVTSLIKNDYLAATEFHYLIRGIHQYNSSFLKCNAIWWTCNYAALTLSLHFFGFWVASKSSQARFIALGMDSSELEVKLRECLDTLKAIGVSSAMSVKAHRCLHRHLTFLTRTPPGSSETSQPNGHLGPELDATRDYQQPQVIPQQELPLEDSAYFMTNPNAEWFGGFNMQDVFGVDPLGLGLGISDFDATGLI